MMNVININRDLTLRRTAVDMRVGECLVGGLSLCMIGSLYVCVVINGRCMRYHTHAYPVRGKVYYGLRFTCVCV